MTLYPFATNILGKGRGQYYSEHEVTSVEKMVLFSPLIVFGAITVPHTLVTS